MPGGSLGRSAPRRRDSHGEGCNTVGLTQMHRLHAIISQLTCMAYCRLSIYLTTYLYLCIAIPYNFCAIEQVQFIETCSWRQHLRHAGNLVSSHTSLIRRPRVLNRQQALLHKVLTTVRVTAIIASAVVFVRITRMNVRGYNNISWLLTTQRSVPREVDSVSYFP